MYRRESCRRLLGDPFKTFEAFNELSIGFKEMNVEKYAYWTIEENFFCWCVYTLDHRNLSMAVSKTARNVIMCTFFELV